MTEHENARAEPIPRWLQWSETCLLTVVAPIAGLWLRPGDVCFIKAHFFWPLLGPVMAGLRYGSTSAVVSASLLCAILLAATRGHVPGQIIAGMLVITLIAGEVRARLNRQLERSEALCRAAVTRTARFVRAYHALTASHDHLERLVRKSGGTLREALASLRRRLAIESPGHKSEQELQREVLALFKEFTGAHVSSYYAADSRGFLQPSTECLGTAPLVRPSHPMLQESLSRGEVVSTSDIAATGPVAVVPLIDGSGTVQGGVVVHETSLTVVDDDTLRLMSILGETIADLIASSRRSTSAQGQAELQRALFHHRRHGLDTTLVRLRVDTPEEILTELATERRASDSFWLAHDDAGAPVLVFALPLTDEVGARVFAGRVQNATCHRVTADVHSITSEDTIESLTLFIRKTGPFHEKHRRRLVGV